MAAGANVNSLIRPSGTVRDPVLGRIRSADGDPALRERRTCPSVAAADELDDGPVLGVLPHARYSGGAVQISAGDTLIVYSDGINEAEDLFGFGFGEWRQLKTECGSLPA